MACSRVLSPCLVEVWSAGKCAYCDAASTWGLLVGPFLKPFAEEVKLEAGGPAATAAESDREQCDKSAGATGSRGEQKWNENGVSWR
jgi:hypothetical protein